MNAMNGSKPMFSGLLAAMVLVGCATTSKRRSEYIDVKGILQTMMESKTVYAVSFDSTVAPIDLSIQGNQEATFSPMVYKYRTGKNEFSVTDRPKKKSTLEAIAAGEDAFAKNEYGSARSRYQEAMRSEPGYFKSYGMIGDTYYNENRFDSAEFYFKKSIAINPYDYQSDWFLSDTYVKIGKRDSALKYLVKAWAINKNSKEINVKMLAMAKDLNYKVRQDRTTFHFNYERMTSDSVKLVYRDKSALEELGLSNCLACFEFEEGFRGNAEKGGFRKDMFLNCFGNHMQVLKKNSEKGPLDNEINRRLLEIYEQGLMRAYIVWEIGTNADPHAVIFEDEAELGKIERYILDYVLVKN